MAGAGHRGGAEVDVAALVIAGGQGAELLEFVDRPLDGVAFLVAVGVEAGGRPPRDPLRRRAARESDFSGMACRMWRPRG
jgi:hypothetical protein